MRTRTKIICTMGPAVISHEKISGLIDAGMNVARINMSHGTHDEHGKTIRLLKKVRQEKQVPLAIMLDTKGPEMRIGELEQGTLTLEEGMKIRLGAKGAAGDPITLPINPASVIADIPIGSQVLFCDGYIGSSVIDRDQDGIILNIENHGILRSGKGVNVPCVDLDLPAVTERDIEDICFGCRQGIDLLAASFIRSAEHILEIKELLAREKSFHVLVIAKIESALGVTNFDAILQAADGIMVARGDLGVELPLHDVPKLQKMMIQKCNQAFKPVITATQMLESMIGSPRPTRAEVSDVANAVYDGTDMVMLSGETAVGKYPIKTVSVMKKAALAAERDIHYREIFFRETASSTFHAVSFSVALAAVKTAYSSQGKGLIALTTRGFTARIMAGFRPDMPIIAITSDESSYHQLAFVWGVVPVLAKVKDLQEGIARGSALLLEQKFAEYGDLIIVTSGSPFGVTGTTNMMMIDHIGTVRVRGKPGKGKKVFAPVTLIVSFDPESDYPVAGKLVVIPHCDERYEPLLAKAAGVILENHPDDLHSEQWARRLAKQLDLPLLLRADAACYVLKEGEKVTLDPVKGVVFAGNVYDGHPPLDASSS